MAVAPELHAPPGIPAWAARLVERGAERSRPIEVPGLGRAGMLTVRAAGPFAVASARLARADALDAAQLRSATTSVYRSIRAGLAATPAHHPIRMWNFIPGIHEPLAEGIDRYQVFNVGRFEAFLEWLGEPDKFPRLLPTATGVGHDGHALLVFALGAAEPGCAVENVRQRPAFRYSRRYGARPPCFARATRASFPDGERLLIGGTASVRGEDSVHEGSLEGQIGELFKNLRSLVSGNARGDRLELIRDARVYYRRASDAARIKAEIARRLPAVEGVELVRADICRRELLLELEAIADAPPPQS